MCVLACAFVYVLTHASPIGFDGMKQFTFKFDVVHPFVCQCYQLTTKSCRHAEQYLLSSLVESICYMFWSIGNHDQVFA